MVNNVALIKAAYGGHAKVVELLLSCEDINVNYENSNNNTALVVASMCGYTDVVKLLLDHKDIDMDYETKNGHTALIVASQHGHTKIVELLLNNKNKNSKCATKYYNASLITAAYHNQASVVKVFLSCKDINVNYENSNNQTALVAASMCGYTDVVKLLLDHKDIDMDYETKNGYTALIVASQHGHAKVVELLLNNENKNSKCATKNCSASLITAAYHNQANVVKVFLSCKNIDVNYENSNNNTALVAASMCGYTDVVKLLLDHKNIDVDYETKNGNTALHVASSHGHAKVVELLLNIKKKIIDNAAIIAASSSGHIDVVKLLLEKKQTNMLKDTCVSINDYYKVDAVKNYENLIDQNSLFFKNYKLTKDSATTSSVLSDSLVNMSYNDVIINIKNELSTLDLNSHFIETPDTNNLQNISTVIKEWLTDDPILCNDTSIDYIYALINANPHYYCKSQLRRVIESINFAVKDTKNELIKKINKIKSDPNWIEADIDVCKTFLTRLKNIDLGTVEHTFTVVPSIYESTQIHKQLLDVELTFGIYRILSEPIWLLSWLIGLFSKDNTNGLRFLSLTSLKHPSTDQLTTSQAAGIFVHIALLSVALDQHADILCHMLESRKSIYSHLFEVVPWLNNVSNTKLLTLGNGFLYAVLTGSKQLWMETSFTSVAPSLSQEQYDSEKGNRIIQELTNTLHAAIMTSEHVDDTGKIIQRYYIITIGKQSGTILISSVQQTHNYALWNYISKMCKLIIKPQGNVSLSPSEEHTNCLAPIKGISVEYDIPVAKLINIHVNGHLEIANIWLLLAEAAFKYNYVVIRSSLVFDLDTENIDFKPIMHLVVNDHNTHTNKTNVQITAVDNAYFLAGG